MSHNFCALCEVPLEKHSIADGEHLFCCLGCHTVYQILLTRSQLENIKENALFKQAVRSGLISNPTLLEELKRNKPEVPEGELEKIHFEINDMWCPSCAEVIRLILLKHKGIRNCVIDYATDLAAVEYAPRYISKESIFKEIKNLGYSPRMFNDAEQYQVNRLLMFRLGISGFFTLNIMMCSYPLYATYFSPDTIGGSSFFVWISFLASLPVLFFGGWPIFQRFLTTLRVGIMGMETLIVIGVLSAFGLSIYQMSQGISHVYFDSMSVIITFVLLGKVVESRAKFSAKECLLRLARAVPKRGRKRCPDNTELFVPVKEIVEGDLLVVLTGERVVLDGVVVSGTGSCDESLMTGEAIPVRKEEGSPLVGGSILVQGKLTYRVTATETKTALHQILCMVEQDIGQKTVYTRAVDPIIRYFVPVVLVLAGLTIFCCLWIGYSVESSIVRAMTVLLISCPCAIGIAAPLAESQILNGMAKLGAIIRNRGCLEILGKETVFVFDKTGTITEGNFKVIGAEMNGSEIIHEWPQILKGLASQSKLNEPKTIQEWPQILKGLASQSTHPISCAIARSILEPGVQFDSTEEVAGRGIRGWYKGSEYKLGSAAFTQLLDRHSLSNEIQTQVYFTCNDHLVSKLVLGDQIRQGASDLIKNLSPVETILLSGDSAVVVESVAKACHFNRWYSECSPLKKRDVIDQLRARGEVVAMMGDGINDAPALTGAHIGISVVTATDVSIQVSDVMLTTDRLDVIPKIRVLADRGRKIIRQNLFWAFIYNVIGLGLAMFGLLNPLLSAVAMMLSSIIVIFNARRV